MFIKRIHIFNIIYCGLFVAPSFAMLQLIPKKSFSVERAAQQTLVRQSPIINRHCSAKNSSTRKEVFTIYKDGQVVISEYNNGQLIKQFKNIVASEQDLIENKDRLLANNLWPIGVDNRLENKLETNEYSKKIMRHNIASGLELISKPITVASGLAAIISTTHEDALDFCDPLIWCDPFFLSYTMPPLITCALGGIVWVLTKTISK